MTTATEIATNIVTTRTIANSHESHKIAHYCTLYGAYVGLTYSSNSVKTYEMIRCRITGWNISPASSFLLGGVIVLMLLVVVLPDDVDLPDAAFHRGTAPVVVHAQATSGPSSIIIAAAVPLPSPSETLSRSYRQWDPELYPAPNFRPILLRSIRR